MCVMNHSVRGSKPDDATKSVVIKCDFCKDLGGEPSCVKARPKQANSRRGGITYAKYAIIGIGAAGMTAAKTLRELAPEDEIKCNDFCR